MQFRISRKYLIILILPALTALSLGDCRSFIIKKVFISKELEGVNLSGLDFYNTNLENINLSRSKLVNANFSFSNLKQARFINADLRRADLSAANCTGADLRGANLMDADLSNAMLKKTNLVGAYFYGANLSDADMRDAIMVIGVPEGSDMTVIHETMNLSGLVQYAHFRNADFSGTAVSMKWKNFIKQQGVRNYNKIIWAK